MTTLVLADYLADLSLAIRETVHDKPTIDERGNWVNRLTALSRDGRGWHDRPLLTRDDLTTPAPANAKDART